MARIFACLAAFLVLANCAVTPQAATDPVATSTRAVTTPSPASRDVTCLAEALYFEARGTGEVGKEAVGHVVLNRMKNREFPNTVCGVISDRCQFSYRCDGRPDTLTDTASRARAFRTAETVLGGTPDITSGALFFHSARVKNPGWFNTRQRVGTFGGNVFYR
jgi:spore germination cell wall hydrolase CwlJ-like protein